MYSQVSFEHICIDVELKYLIPFLDFISDKKSKFCGDKKYEIFKDINKLKEEKWENYKKKVKFNIDNKYTLKAGEYVKRFALEVKFNKILDLTFFL